MNRLFCGHKAQFWTHIDIFIILKSPSYSHQSQPEPVDESLGENDEIDPLIIQHRCEYGCKLVRVQAVSLVVQHLFTGQKELFMSFYVYFDILMFDV